MRWASQPSASWNGEMLTEILIFGSQSAASRSASRDDMLGQAPDQADFLGDRNEHVGPDHSRKRVDPAREHLEADDLAGREVHLRLEIGHELAVLEAEADALLDLAMGDQRALHARIEPDRPRDAAAARMVHRDVGAAQDVGDAGSRRGAEAMPAKAPTWMIRSSNSKGRVTVRRTASASSSARPIAPPASARATANSSPLSRASTASGPSSSVKRDGKRLQQPVAGLIAVLVVDRFEAVDLERDDDQVITPRCGFGAKLGRVGPRSPCGCRGR